MPGRLMAPASVSCGPKRGPRRFFLRATSMSWAVGVGVSRPGSLSAGAVAGASSATHRPATTARRRRRRNNKSVTSASPPTGAGGARPSSNSRARSSAPPRARRTRRCRRCIPAAASCSAPPLHRRSPASRPPSPAIGRRRQNVAACVANCRRSVPSASLTPQPSSANECGARRAPRRARRPAGRPSRAPPSGSSGWRCDSCGRSRPRARAAPARCARSRGARTRGCASRESSSRRRAPPAAPGRAARRCRGRRSLGDPPVDEVATVGERRRRAVGLVLVAAPQAVIPLQRRIAGDLGPARPRRWGCSP